MAEPDRQAVDAAIALFGIPVEPAWRDAAHASFVAVAAAASLVAAFPMEDEAEYAPAFQA